MKHRFSSCLLPALSLLLIPVFVIMADDNEYYQSRQGLVRQSETRQGTEGRREDAQNATERYTQARASYNFVPRYRYYQPRTYTPRANEYHVNPRRYIQRPSFDKHKVMNYFERRFDTDGDGYLSLAERERMVQYVQQHPNG